MIKIVMLIHSKAVHLSTLLPQVYLFTIVRVAGCVKLLPQQTDRQRARQWEDNKPCDKGGLFHAIRLKYSTKFA